MKDGRNATTAYRVRVGGTWYWVDPRVPPADIEPGDTVVIYPADGAAALAILQGAPGSDTVAFASLEGERFECRRARSPRCISRRSTTNSPLDCGLGRLRVILRHPRSRPRSSAG